MLAARASSRRRLIGLGVVNLILMGAVLGLYLAVSRAAALAGIGSGPTLARMAEFRPVIDLTTLPAQAAASLPAPRAMPASEPLPAVALALASAPLAVTSPKPASAASAVPKALKP